LKSPGLTMCLTSVKGDKNGGALFREEILARVSSIKRPSDYIKAMNPVVRTVPVRCFYSGILPVVRVVAMLESVSQKKPPSLRIC
jgi:hypothetical protein